MTAGQSPQRIVIVDFGMGNLRSLQSKLKMIKIDAVVSSSSEEIDQADKLILPGVGHFAMGMANIIERGLLAPLNKRVLKDKTPILGICLGMQLLGEHSEEGNVEGLGWLPMKIVKFNFATGDVGSKTIEVGTTHSGLRIPHVGWNHIKLANGPQDLLKDLPLEMKRFYFTHSYHSSTESQSFVSATTDYGYSFPSVVQKENIFGTQFHPEKSHFTGLRLIENFVRTV